VSTQTLTLGGALDPESLQGRAANQTDRQLERQPDRPMGSRTGSLTGCNHAADGDAGGRAATTRQRAVVAVDQEVGVALAECGLLRAGVDRPRPWRHHILAERSGQHRDRRRAGAGAGTRDCIGKHCWNEGSFVWLPYRDQMSYSARQTGPTISHWLH
jgi:hypothetical protein